MITDYETAHQVILACTKLLDEFNTEDCALEHGNERLIPAEVNNPFIKSGLVSAIRLAADFMVKSKGGAV